MKKARVDAGPAACRRPSPKKAAETLAFTPSSQMPAQLGRFLSVSIPPIHTLGGTHTPFREERASMEEFGCLLNWMFDVWNEDRGNEGVAHRSRSSGVWLLLSLQEWQIAFERAQLDCWEKNPPWLPQSRSH